MKARFGLVELAVCVLVTCTTIALVLPALADGERGSGLRTRCISNLKQQATAMLAYTEDHDDRLPERDSWMDSLAGRLRNTEVFVCPERRPRTQAQCGYAFNSSLALQAISETPSDTPVIYDSLNLARNASDPFLSFPPCRT